MSLVLAGRTLPEIAAVLCGELQNHDVVAVVVGGSALTLHVPEIYTSLDIDLATPRGPTQRYLHAVMIASGFELTGRIYKHPETPVTVDFVADTPRIDERYIEDYALIATAAGPARTYRFEDAIADRVAHYVHWNDLEALDVVLRAVVFCAGQMETHDALWPKIEKALSQLTVPTTDGRARLATALRGIAIRCGT